MKEITVLVIKIEIPEISVVREKEFPANFEVWGMAQLLQKSFDEMAIPGQTPKVTVYPRKKMVEEDSSSKHWYDRFIHKKRKG